MPSNPDQAYRKKGWVNWGEFLGTGLTSSRAYDPHTKEQKPVQVEERSALRE